MKIKTIQKVKFKKHKLENVIINSKNVLIQCLKCKDLLYADYMFKHQCFIDFRSNEKEKSKVKKILNLKNNNFKKEGIIINSPAYKVNENTLNPNNNRIEIKDTKSIKKTIKHNYKKTYKKKQSFIEEHNKTSFTNNFYQKTEDSLLSNEEKEKFKSIAYLNYLLDIKPVVHFHYKMPNMYKTVIKTRKKQEELTRNCTF